ncbi:hypothetical protein Tco_1208943, partial [Tanacetum coccineum]
MSFIVSNMSICSFSGGNELGLPDLALGEVNGGLLTVYQDDRWSHRVGTGMFAYMVRPIAHFGRSSVHTEETDKTTKKKRADLILKRESEIRATSFERIYIVRLEIVTPDDWREQTVACARKKITCYSSGILLMNEALYEFIRIVVGYGSFVAIPAEETGMLELIDSECERKQRKISWSDVLPYDSI